MPVCSATLIQISGTRTPSRSRHAIWAATSTARRSSKSPARTRTAPPVARAGKEGRGAEPVVPPPLGPRILGLGLEDGMQALGRGGLAQLLQCARLKLAYPFSRKAQRLADLFEGVFLLAAESVAQTQDQLLPGCQAPDQRTDAGAHAVSIDPTVRSRSRRVGHEILETLLRACHRRLEGDRLPRETVQGLQGIGVGAERRGQLRGRRLPTELAREFRTHALTPLQAVMHVGR